MSEIKFHKITAPVMKIIDDSLHMVLREFLATELEARVRFMTLPGKKVMSLERDPLSLVSTTEELLDRKVAAPVYKTENTAVGIRHADYVAPSIRKELAIT
jgi:hypothetical protein